MPEIFLSLFFFFSSIVILLSQAAMTYLVQVIGSQGCFPRRKTFASTRVQTCMGTGLGTDEI